MKTNEIEYVLTLTPQQAQTIRDAVDLMMRLKIKQPEELAFKLIPADPHFCEKRDKANPLFKAGFDALFDGKDSTEWKDAEWHRLYGIFQVLRHEIFMQNGGSQYSWSIAADKPRITLESEPLPKIEVRKL